MIGNTVVSNDIAGGSGDDTENLGTTPSRNIMLETRLRSARRRGVTTAISMVSLATKVDSLVTRDNLTTTCVTGNADGPKTTKGAS